MPGKEIIQHVENPISQEDIKILLEASKYIVVYFDNLIFTNTDIFNEKIYQYTYLVFRNCTFNETFNLYNRSIGNGVYLRECIFKKDLILKNITAIGKNPLLVLNGSNIFLYACEIKGAMRIAGTLESSASVKKCTIGVLKIEKLEIKEFLEIVDSTIHNIDIHILVTDEILVSENKIIDFSITHLKCRSFQVISNSILRFIHYRQYFMSQDHSLIYIVDNTFDEFYISLGLGSNGLILLNYNVMKRSARIDTNGHNAYWDRYFKVSYDAKSEIRLFIEGNSCDSAFIIKPESNWGRPPKFKFLKLSFSPSNRGTFNFDSVDVEHLIINGANSGSSLVIYSLTIYDCLEFVKFANFSNIQISNLKVIENIALLKIIDSNLGKTHFVNCDLSSFKSVVIRDSNLSELQYSSVKWFEENQLIDEPKTRYEYTESKKSEKQKLDEKLIEDIKKVSQLYDIFKQLKQSAEKASDKNLITKFRSIENKYYYLRLRLTVPFFNRERILMSLGRTNSFGTNWTKPIWLALGITFATYLLLIILITCKQQNSFSAFCEGFRINVLNLSGALPQLFNPTHTLSIVFDTRQHPEIKFYFLSQTIDLLQRITVSYLIFQTIVAFRKQSH